MRDRVRQFQELLIAASVLAIALFTVEAFAQSCPAGQTSTKTYTGTCTGAASGEQSGMEAAVQGCADYAWAGWAAGCNASASTCQTSPQVANCQEFGSAFQCDLQYTNVAGPASPNICGANPAACGLKTIAGAFSGDVHQHCAVNACSSKAGQEAFVGIGTSVTGQLCDGGCEVNQQVTTQIRCTPGGDESACSNTWVAQTSYTGAQCSTPNVKEGQCVSAGGKTVCGEPGKNCGTFNGDEVCPQSIPPGTCVSFASGGVACTASSDGTVHSPPAPDSGTPGTPATSSGSVTNNNTVTNYYSSSVVNGSSGGVQSNPGGQNTGNGGTGSGSSQGTVSVKPNAANGDCGADGVQCGSDGSTPNLPDQKTIEQASSDYYAGLASVPIVAAVSALSGAIPTGGSCPTATISVFGKDFVMDAQCTILDQVAPILSAIMLAVWALIGVRIVMSA